MNTKVILCFSLALCFAGTVNPCLFPPKPSLLSVLTELRNVMQTKQLTLEQVINLMQMFKLQGLGCQTQQQGTISYPWQVQQQQQPAIVQPCQMQQPPIIQKPCQSQPIQVPVQLVHFVNQPPVHHPCTRKPLCPRKCNQKVTNALNKMCLHFATEKCDQ